ncbi:head-tail connector protein [Massilia sp. DD77]|uniref:head-tail connector protein n=1 Tax=Massilia sp. DD77 TaxID=3109349 RepID=UPI002FFF83DF
MVTRCVVPPIGLAVSLADAIAAARAEGAGMDDQVEKAVRFYTDEVEALTRRAIVEQTWEVTLDAFPIGMRGGAGAFELDNPPVIAVLQISFYDPDGQLRLLDPQDYQVDRLSEPGYVVPARGRTWPVSEERVHAVSLRYTAGYGADYSAVPEGIQGYILGRVYEHFAPEGTRTSETLHRLLDRYKVYG